MTEQERISRALFGGRVRKVNMAELSRETDIPERTLYEYRDNPYTIPLDRLRVICKVACLTDEQRREVIG